MTPFCTYLMPIRRKRFDAAEAGELRDYLSILKPGLAEIIVVDGSSPEVFAYHHQAWSEHCRHEPVDPRFGYLNDKVNGIHTGIGLAATSKLILADDDIRYTPDDIREMCKMLDEFEVVRPQNYLALGENNPTTLPWWAKMEAARMLTNRALLRAADYPGTCAFRRETMLRAGDYDGDVLFDNEEIIRHFARSGARMLYANDFFIRKRPPIFRKWIEQRPRQAYEDFGMRAKTALFAVLLPCLIFNALFAGIKAVSEFTLLLAMISILLAFVGRARGSAREFFALNHCLFAPLWLLERTLSTYWAFLCYMRRGGYPFGDRLLRKGIGRDWVEGGRIASQIAATPRPPK